MNAAAPAKASEQGRRVYSDLAKGGITLLWAFSIACAAVAFGSNTVNLPVMVPPLVACALIAWLWIRCQDGYRQASRDRRLAAIPLALLAAACVGGVSWAARGVVDSYSQRLYDEDVEAFSSDPGGLPWLQKLAREHFGVAVVLVRKEGWAATSQAVPGSSVALMVPGTGYCQLYLHKSNVFRYRGMPALNGVDEELWLRGILVHELAHCVDISRDLPTLERGAVATHSVLPSDAPAVKDYYSLFDAGYRPSTQLWREAVADLVAIGFWRVVAPDQAIGLAAALKESRRRAAGGDPEHATMCWIDYAARAESPGSMAAVFLWADRLRSEAPCARSSGAG